MSDSGAQDRASVRKSEADWRGELDQISYHVLREGGTERPFTGLYWDCKDPGTYVCKGCGTPLFSSETKYDSGSGWPSFHSPRDSENIEERTDNSMGMQRTEVLCSTCGGHLGHVFHDGPEPTGLRYCINSASLKLEEES